MDPTHLSADFRDFLTCLNAAGVEYLVVGGHAVAYYGYVRPTLDILAIKPTSKNSWSTRATSAETNWSSHLAGSFCKISGKMTTGRQRQNQGIAMTCS